VNCKFVWALAGKACEQCAAVGVTRAQFLDAFNVALVVGGSITIPHLRRAIERMDQVLAGLDTGSSGDHTHG
jgi:hypothetical protein